MFKTAVFLTIIFAVIFKANSLQCYVCYDCEKLSDDYLTSCDSLLSTTTTTTTTSTVQPPTNSASASTKPSSTITSTNSTTTSSNTTESTTTPTTNTTTTTTTTEAPLLQIQDFAEGLERANTTWECVKGTIPVNGSGVIIRGCAAGRTNETCDIFGLSSCSFCSSDKCNAAGSIQVSVVVLAVAFFAYLSKNL